MAGAKPLRLFPGLVWGQAAGLLFCLLAGCGAQYRPVVTPITPTGPASQPTAYYVAISAPSATAPGLVTIVDAFGDTVVGQATLANGPFSFNLNASGSLGFNIDSGATSVSSTAASPSSFVLNSYGISVGTSTGGGIRTQNISTSTIPLKAYPFNAFSTTGSLYLIEPYTDPTLIQSSSAAASTNGGNYFVAQLTGAIPAVQQEIPVAPNPVNFAGASGASRLYAISQGSFANGPLPTPNSCGSSPSTVTVPGEADSIEVATNTVSRRIPLGICPVYGIMSPDHYRAYILNRGSNNITVINVQTNALDTVANGVGSTIPVGAGPVYADLYPQSQLLVTANYDSNTVSVINVPTDVYANDGPTFGTTVPPIPVGSGPVALTILRDGSRAYVANQNDCSVSVVNLSSFVVTKTISLPPLANPDSTGSTVCHPKAIASVYSTPAGTVYVASANSNVLTVINTETDTVSASVQLPGNAVSVFSTTQNAVAASNAIVNSNAAGLGVPCAPTDTSPFCTVLEK